MEPLSQLAGDQRDSVVANLVGVPCNGHGETIYVVADSSNSLAAIPVTGYRAKWRTGSYPYTAFMRNCNLTRTPRSCRGMLCIFRKNRNDPKHWLGVVGNLSPLWNNVVTVYQWSGDSVMDSGVFTPEFLYSADEFPITFDKVRSDFKKIHLYFEEGSPPPDLFFVNTVSSHPHVRLQHHCINSVDGCFEMCPAGPDVIIEAQSLPHVQNVAEALDRGPDLIDVTNRSYGSKDQPTKGYPACLVESKKVIHHLPSVFHTIRSEGCPHLGEQMSGMVCNKIAVPYVHQPTDPSQEYSEIGSFLENDSVKIAFISKKAWSHLVKQEKRVTIRRHNRYLDLNAATTMTLRVLKLDQAKKGGIRISIANQKELTPFIEQGRWVRDAETKDCYTCQCFSEGNEFGPGNVIIRYMIQRRVSVSVCNFARMWHRFLTLHCITQVLSISIAVVLYLWSTFRKAFGDRLVTACCGINLYVAARGAHSGHTRAKVNTLEGPGTIKKNTYWRANFVDIKAPAAYKVINDLQSVAKSNMCMMDPIIVGACKDATGVDEKRNICSTAIVTAGSPTEGYGFSNSMHVDANDRVPKHMAESLVNLLRSISLSSDCLQKRRIYVMDWIRRFGCLSVPTTCAYEFLGEFGDADEFPVFLLAFFLFPPLHVALLLESGTALQFYAAVVQHQTSAVLAVNATHVSYGNGKGYVLAWGEGSRSGEGTGGAEPVVPPPEPDIPPPGDAGGPNEAGNQPLNLGGNPIDVTQTTGDEAGTVWTIWTQDQGAPAAGLKCVAEDSEHGLKHCDGCDGAGISASSTEDVFAMDVGVDKKGRGAHEEQRGGHEEHASGVVEVDMQDHLSQCDSSTSSSSDESLSNMEAFVLHLQQLQKGLNCQ